MTKLIVWAAALILLLSAVQAWAAEPLVGRWLLKSQEVGGQQTDADPLTPAVNAISVGEEPIAIAPDNSGCFEVTANAGSCDVSVIDVKSVYLEHFPTLSAKFFKFDHFVGRRRNDNAIFVPVDRCDLLGFV